VQQAGLCQVLSFDKSLTADGHYVSYANGEVLYRDDNHPTAQGSVWMLEQIGPDFLEMIRPAETAKNP